MALTPLVAIVGRPNVGKSTLFNRLVGYRRAITSDAAGTTRDAVTALVDWQQRQFLLVDTAGLQKAADELGLQVQDQISAVSQTADLMLVVVEAGTIITTEDRQAAKQALKTGKPVILVINKIDTAAKGLADDFKRLGISQVYEVSALHGRGSGDLLDAITAQIKARPASEQDQSIRVAILGRPNVGKSSLFNKLGAKQQALVSDTAGTTRDLNFLRLRYHGETIELMDTAGLLRPSKTKGIEKFSALRTVAAIAGADICLLVMDAGELGVARDQHIAGLVIEAGKGLVLVANKWDAVEKDEQTQAKLTRRLQTQFQFCWWAPLVFTSATTGLHSGQLLELVQQIWQRRCQQLPTPELNQLLQQLTTKQAPAGLKGRQPKINYITQVDTQPPRFALFTSHPDLIHFSYQRYLENGLRAQYDFSGTPIKLEFRDKREQKK